MNLLNIYQVIKSTAKDKRAQVICLSVIAATLHSKGKRAQAIATGLVALAIARQYSTRSSAEALSQLIKYGAEARIHAKYFASNLGIVTFRSERANELKILTALTLASLTLTGNSSATSQYQEYHNKPVSTRHIVFLSCTGLSALWCPTMARLLTMRKLDLNEPTVVHAVELSQSEGCQAELSKWLRRDLQTEGNEKVTLVAHGREAAQNIIAQLRQSPDLCSLISLVLVNPLASASAHYPAELPYKAELLGIYNSLCVWFARMARVLHEGCPPLIDPAVVEFALLSGQHCTSDDLEISSPLPCEVSMVCGDQDWAGGRGKYEAFAEKLGVARQVVFLRGLGACPHLEDPEKLAEAVANN